MYQRPVLQKYGHFRDLTRLGLSSSTDGFAIFGVSSPGCSTTWYGTTYEIGCENPIITEPTTS